MKKFEKRTRIWDIKRGRNQGWSSNLSLFHPQNIFSPSSSKEKFNLNSAQCLGPVQLTLTQAIGSPDSYATISGDRLDQSKGKQKCYNLLQMRHKCSYVVLL